MNGLQPKPVYLEFEQMLDDLIEQNKDIGENEHQELSRLYRDNKLIRLLHAWGTNIRNHYGLWHEEHPITKQWRRNGGGPNDINHPDAVSLRLIEAFCERTFGPKEL